MNALDLVFPLAIAASTIVTLAIKEQNKKAKELEQLLSADSHRQLVPDIRTENMPPALRVLIPYIEKYSIGDDLTRVKLAERLSKKKKQELLDVVGPLLPEINIYLDSFVDKPLSDEAILIGALAEFVCELPVKTR